MTALCGGGASQARPAFGAAVSIGIGQISGLLSNVPTPLAVAAGGYIGLISYDLANFCNTDPPPMPTPTAGDWVALITVSDPVAHLAAVKKFQDLIANLVWPQFCECSATATPAPPALPSPPAGLPTVQPPQVPVGQPSQPCWSADQLVGYVGGAINIPWHTLLWPDPTDTSDLRGSGVANVGSPPFVSTTISGSIVDFGTADPLTGIQVGLQWTNASGSIVSSTFNGSSTAHSATVTGSPPATAVRVNYQVNVYATDPFGVPDGHVDLSIKMTCAGQNPTQPVQPCCPPDPSLQAELDSMYALIQSIYQSLPAPLNSYADGAVHSGLSGDGTQALTGFPLAIRVNITSLPDYVGFDVGDPTFFFDVGYIVPVVNSAPIRGETRLVYNPQMYLLPALTESIGYSLRPGVVISITELVRGP